MFVSFFQLISYTPWHTDHDIEFMTSKKVFATVLCSCDTRNEEIKFTAGNKKGVRQMRSKLIAVVCKARVILGLKSRSLTQIFALSFARSFETSTIHSMSCRRYINSTHLNLNSINNETQPILHDFLIFENIFAMLKSDSICMWFIFSISNVEWESKHNGRAAMNSFMRISRAINRKRWILGF